MRIAFDLDLGRVLEPKRRVIFTNTKSCRLFCLESPSSRRCTAFATLGHFVQLED